MVVSALSLSEPYVCKNKLKLSTPEFAASETLEMAEEALEVTEEALEEALEEGSPVSLAGEADNAERMDATSAADCSSLRLSSVA